LQVKLNPILLSFKSIFVESQMRDIFASNMADYYSKIHEPDGKGACFLAVCRGKVIICFFLPYFTTVHGNFFLSGF
jgi:hypothetical protein